MNNRSGFSGDRLFKGLYRDRENGYLFGVCAGIAEYANFRAGSVRIIAIICLLLFFWPTVIVYAALTVLLREKPLIYAGRNAEYEFWRYRERRGRWSHS